MQSQAELNPLDDSFALRSALFSAPFSRGALVSSLFLHVLVVGAVLWFSRGEHRPGNPVFFMDLKGVAVAPKTAQEPKFAPRPAAVAPKRAATDEVSAQQLEAAAKASPLEEPAPPSAEPAPQPAAENRAEEIAQAPSGVPASAQIAAPQAMSEVELRYRRAVWERVQEVALPWSVRSSRWLFEGWVSFHLCLDASGRLLHDPVLLEDEEGRKHRDLRAVPTVLRLAPPEQLPQFLDWHFRALMEALKLALIHGQPYPAAPAGLVIPENMAFPIDLNAYDPPRVEAGPG